MFISTDPFPYKGRRPNDPSVVDSQTARAHEYNVHIDPAIDSVRSIIIKFLKKNFKTEADLKKEGDKVVKRVGNEFATVLFATQYRENHR
jgi:hypothetical protein